MNDDGTSQSLRTQAVCVRFAGISALESVSLTLDPKQVLGVIGPNGAGKTTLVNVLTGFQKPTSGDIFIGPTLMSDRPAHQIARAGIARTFQGVKLFRTLTVWENVAAGAIGTGHSRGQIHDTTAEVLSWMGLEQMSHMVASSLPYGHERLIGVARALAMKPRFLLLDEPAAGLNEAEADSLIERISEIPGRFNCGVLLIEHNMRIVLNVCEALHVLDGGRTIATGDTDEVKNNPAVIEAYLGTKKARTCS